MKKTRFRFKLRKTIIFISLTIMLLFFLAVLSLDNYLYKIQREERLSKIENYSEFTITVNEEKRCQNRKIIDIGNKSLNFYCFDQVYIHYGSVTIFLIDALKNNYITIEDILSHTTKIEDGLKNGGVNVYIYENKKSNTIFAINVDQSSITFKPF